MFDLSSFCGRATLKMVMHKKLQRGFTIVELLIVVVVIGVLAAIVIVAYNGITSSAQASTIKSDLTNALKKLEIYKIENGAYPVTGGQLANVGIKASKSSYDTVGNNFYYCVNTVTDVFAMGSRTPSNTHAFIISGGSPQQVSVASGDTVCQAAGLTGWTDPDGYISNGYNNGGSGWQAWTE